MTTTIKFDKDAMLDLISGDPHEGYTLIEDEIDDTTRWSVLHTVIFAHNGRFYRAHYSRGATEQQCEDPWEYEDDVDATEVFKSEKLVTVYE